MWSSTLFFILIERRDIYNARESALAEIHQGVIESSNISPRRSIIYAPLYRLHPADPVVNPAEGFFQLIHLLLQLTKLLFCVGGCLPKGPESHTAPHPSGQARREEAVSPPSPAASEK
jgi:hypothetical protein